MPDVFSKKKRSEVMSRIRSRGNKETEVALAKLFRRHKITGWRRHLRIVVHGPKLRAADHQPSTKAHQLAVRPDFVFPKARLAVFVDGCFWHGCPKHGTKPKGNAPFWLKKISGNRTRDLLVNRTLRRARWHVLRIWEHDLAKRKQARVTRRLHRALQ